MILLQNKISTISEKTAGIINILCAYNKVMCDYKTRQFLTTKIIIKKNEKNLRHRNGQKLYKN